MKHLSVLLTTIGCLTLFGILSTLISLTFNYYYITQVKETCFVNNVVYNDKCGNKATFKISLNKYGNVNVYCSCDHPLYQECIDYWLTSTNTNVSCWRSHNNTFLVKNTLNLNSIIYPICISLVLTIVIVFYHYYINYYKQKSYTPLN
jgi:hypothetical protein